ncbi:FMN-binding protein [Candidatus Colwellia aromaticivorans]|uniref:FMN-binding protein n=1 Tax=Candidatus Colwellia aromaticivorans TaxID=2267621 RepID=UPI000DF2AF78|nr:FMN-binding protein [Candidatus Colwellia aromaticivorans]
MNKYLPLFIFALTMAFSHVSLAAKGVYQTPAAFISGSFVDATPQAKVLWLTKEDKAVVAKILQHKFNRMRIRYWQVDNETVWILNEIGKEKPITIGVHIKNNHINHFKVLTFRESRGDEVRHEFFSKQFINATLNKENRLSQNVDGITGATLSVRATTKVARLALWLNAKVTNIPVPLEDA